MNGEEKIWIVCKECASPGQIHGAYLNNRPHGVGESLKEATCAQLMKIA